MRCLFQGQYVCTAISEDETYLDQEIVDHCDVQLTIDNVLYGLHFFLAFVGIALIWLLAKKSVT